MPEADAGIAGADGAGAVVSAPVVYVMDRLITFMLLDLQQLITMLNTDLLDMTMLVSAYNIMYFRIHCFSTNQNPLTLFHFGNTST